MLTIIMYHYVRDLARSRHPRIKGLTTERFDGQLDYILRHYRVCSLGQVVAAAQGQAELPDKACLLTFDDGFADHYLTVLPRLLQRGIKGSFFPPAQVIEERRVLDVHKLQFILACCDDTDLLIANVFRFLAEYRAELDMPTDQVLRETYTGESRFDPPEIIFVKQLLQHGLPEWVRAGILASLFAKHVSGDERAFADELYMDIPQLRGMIDRGMSVGGHGCTHSWLEHLSPREQAEEIRQTLAFLARIHGQVPQAWAMCYPYGSYNAVTLELLTASGCRLGLTTRVALNEDLSRPLELSRLDTNDLPYRDDAELSVWTRTDRR